MENALELRGFTKYYQDFSIEGFDLKVPCGCIMGLIGENGAGKSTTIKAIVGALHTDGGQIMVLGCDNSTPDFIRIKEEIGVVLDEACFPEGLTALQVDRIMQGVYKNWETETFLQYLDRFQLPQNKPFKAFSRGMKMKLSIAAALSHRAKLLILDEATGGLDPIVRDEILDVFYEFTRNEQHTVLISSHIVSDLEKICDYIAYIHQGRLVFCEEKDALKERYGILALREADLEAIDPAAVVSSRHTGYGVEALVYRDRVPGTFSVEKADIETIMIALAKKRA